MRNALTTLGLGLLLGSSSSLAVAQSSQEAQPGYESSTMMTARATVQDIDYQDRTVTLKGQNGKVFTVKVGEAARNFNQVHKGDIVTIHRQESLALSLQKAGEPDMSGQQESIMRAPAGQKPGGTAVRTTRLTATVEKIDRQSREVTLRGPEGDTRTLKVDPEVQAFDRLKKGDQVVATFTEAYNLQVTKPHE